MTNSRSASLRLTSVTVASPDPRRVAQFYAKLLRAGCGGRLGDRIRRDGCRGAAATRREGHDRSVGHPFCLFR